MKETDIDDHALAPGDDAEAANLGTGDNICPDCGGTGLSPTGETCPACGGDGKRAFPLGDGVGNG